MYSKSKITGVHKGGIITAPTPMSRGSSSYKSGQGDKLLQASIGGGSGGGGSSAMHVHSYFNSQYQYMMTGLLPADPSYTDTTSLSLFYRDLYLYDNVAGSAVDIMSSFPFSDWQLSGLPEKELQIFEDALNQLNIRELLPTIANAYMVDGFFCGGLIFDAVKKQFQDTILYDALQCTIIHSPLKNTQPQINVRASNSTMEFLASDSKYVKQRLETLPRGFIDMLRKGAFTLNPASTLYVPRGTLTDRPYVSFLHRLLPMYLIEKTMFRGTLVEASRRQRAMTHITAGTDSWVPTGEELGAFVEQFMSAEYDPLGGWIVTRDGVQAQDLRPGGDFWKWTDMSDVLTPYKMRALGISEALLSGDASYAAAESAYSSFLESMESFRNHLTNKVFYSTLFPLIALANNLYVDSSKAIKNGDVNSYLSNVVNRNNLKIPTLKWNKTLEATGEDDRFDILEKMSEKGVPIPLKMWMGAGDINYESLVKDLKEDQAIRQAFKEATGKDTSHEGEEPIYEEASLAGLSIHEARNKLNNHIAPINSGLTRSRRALLSREFNEDEVALKDGKPKHIANQAKYRREMNQNIAKIAARAASDESYRRKLAKANKEKLGRSTLKHLL